MEDMGLSLQDIPGIIGFVDTYELAKEAGFGICGLGKLLAKLEISHARQALHCAGNDAYYTMLAVLGLLQKRHRLEDGAARITALDDLIHRPLPPCRELRIRAREEKRQHREEWVEDGLSQLSDMFGELST
jgi:hypothetical protein